MAVATMETAKTCPPKPPAQPLNVIVLFGYICFDHLASNCLRVLHNQTCTEGFSKRGLWDPAAILENQKTIFLPFFNQ